MGTRLTFLLATVLMLICTISGCETAESVDSDNEDAASDEDDDDASDDDDDDDNDTDEIPALSDPILVVPSEGLPEEVELQGAANNLDLIFYEDEYYLAFRVAPTHFASKTARLYVIRSQDQVNWTLEAEFFLGRDLREPRLLSFDGRLFLYFAVLGSNPLDFEPGYMMVSERLGQGQWTEEEQFYEDGFIAWRTKTIDGVPYMLCYEGGENIYAVDGDPLKVHWLTTDDGYDWYPFIQGQPVVLEGGISETDFVYLEDGALIAASRNEAGDESGYGMKICRAEAGDLGNWQCVHDPKKYDSPLMFKHGEQVYLIGRRNVSADGYYDLGYDSLDPAIEHLLYELDYWIKPKRTSLWRIDPETLDVEFVLDLPSRGDTSFAGLVQLSDDQYVVYNYTSPLDGPDLPWLLGQLGPTQIIRQEISFE